MIKQTKNNMDMKTAKIINGVFWAIIAIVLNIMVCYYWNLQGCETKSLVLGCIVFTAFCAALWFTVHEYLREREEKL